MKKLLSLLLLVLAFLAGCAPTQDQGSAGYRMVSGQEAISLMEKAESHIVLDVRTPEEFADKHIPGAINIPNETIGCDPIPDLPHKDQAIFVYCRSGNRSKQAAEKLAKLGYTNIIEFGGINSWPGETMSG